MMRAGICMKGVDETEIGMYLKVLEHMARENDKDEKNESPRGADGRGGGQIIELRRGYANEFFG